MPFRLAHALLVSSALHLIALATAAALSRAAPTPPRSTPAMLEAVLVPPPQTPPDRLLKDTLAAASTAVEATKPPTPDDPRGRRRVEAQAQRRLAEHVFYPEAAIAQGLEGEVRLLLTLDDAGTIVDVQIAAGSGHALLDDAALRAARHLARLPGVGRRELFLPVRFQLR